ncbi:MAG: hypothetical protein HY719_03965, partial [Planctomycetes bacterium]|nr:hypothetical protein [Planctomycetota bacterium]
HVYSLLLHDMNGDGVKEIFVGCTNNDRVPTGNNFNVPAVFALDARTMKGEALPRSGMVGSGVELWYTFLNDQAVEGIQRLEVVGKTLFCRSQKEGKGSTYAVDVSTGRLGG